MYIKETVGMEMLLTMIIRPFPTVQKLERERSKDDVNTLDDGEMRKGVRN